MYSSPQKLGGASTLFGSPKKVPLKGLFSDGVWHCNCSPRIPASHFEVKKEGPNKGRWFYTCQEPKESSCGFFLWDDAAKWREEHVLINNLRSETDESRTRADASMNKSAVEGHPRASNKWIADLGKADEEEFGEFPSFTGHVEIVAPPAERWTALPGSYPETPRKAVKTDQFATPGSKRKREDALPTPATGGSRGDDVFGTPSTTRLKGGMWDENEHFGLRSPSKTPITTHFRDSTEPAENCSENRSQSYDITDEVMELLKDQHIDEHTSYDLRQLLNKHALKISGIAKGRDITRIALKSKDAKIAELQQRITMLETEREMDKTVIRHFKSDIANSISMRGRGRGRGS